MDSLNNMKKKVLKLEKEINAISLNMTKVKKKEHFKIKNIINNINNMLKKESKQNNLHLNKIDKYNNYIKENEKIEEINNKTIQNFHNNNKNNIDSILISLKHSKAKNKIAFDLSKETIFNKNQTNITKIINRKKKYYKPSSDNKFLKNKINVCENTKLDDLIIKQRSSKYLNKSRNNNNLIYNQMTYSRPKLNTKLTNFNMKKKKQRANSSKDHLLNNILDKNDKINNLTMEKNKSFSTQKYFSTKTKQNQNKNELLYRNSENITNKNLLYINNKNKFKEKLFKKELLYNKKVCQFDELERKENEKNNEEYDDISFDDFSIIKNKNLVFNLKSETNNTYNFNNSSKINSLIQQNNNINTNRNKFLKEKNKSTKQPCLIKNEKNKQRMKSFERMNIKINDDDLYLNEFNSNNNRKEINLKKVNYSIDENNINYNNEEENNIKLIKLLNMLNANNINEAVSKVAKLIKMKKYIDKCKQIYDEDKNNNFINNINNEDIEYNNFHWLSEMMKNYKENKIYKNFCESIMYNHKIECFAEFKKFVNKILFNNRKNNGFLVEVKNILCKDDLYSNNNKENNKENNINKNNYEPHKHKLKKNNNKTFHELDNSNDIKFSRNNENLELNQDWVKTYY